MKLIEFDKINVIYGLIATIGVALFGKYWFLFAGFLILNVIDYATGYCKARFYKKNESSAIGAKGILKKGVLLDCDWISLFHFYMFCIHGRDDRYKPVICTAFRVVHTCYIPDQ